jgi:hypothetical protein
MDHPLTAKELQERQERRVASIRETKKRKRVRNRPTSKFHDTIVGRNLSHLQKARVSEAAVLLRLLTFGFSVFGSPFDGDRTDWLVEIPATGQIHKIQVKTIIVKKQGCPGISLRRSGKQPGTHRRYKDGEFDFIVGYDLMTDIAYVLSADEVAGHTSEITARPNSAERWDKLESERVR